MLLLLFLLCPGLVVAVVVHCSLVNVDGMLHGLQLQQQQLHKLDGNQLRQRMLHELQLQQQLQKVELMRMEQMMEMKGDLNDLL